MKQDKLVSIVIPAYNEQKNIEACLETILNQSYNNYEVIVVDDGSTDKTIEIVQKYPVKLIKQSHQGPAKARNLGAKEAKGEILVFMDSDMTFEKNFIRELVTPIINGLFKGTFSKEEYISNWENAWARCWNYNQGWPKQKMIPDDYPNEGQDFRAILKSEFNRVLGFDNVGYTDTWSLSSKLGYKPHAVKGAKYYHSNPDTLQEVFAQSKWSAKRKYKFGLLGIIVALIRNSLPISLLKAFFQAIKYQEFRFIIFKIVYDFAAFVGIIEMVFKRRLIK